MKKLFNYLFGTTKKSNLFEIKNNCIIFWVDKNHEAYMKTYIVNTDDKNSKVFGNILYEINTGKYIKPILELLLSMSAEDPTINKSVLTIINSWYDLTNYQDNILLDEPLIKPTKFNNK